MNTLGKFIVRITYLISGLSLFSIGIVLTIQANIGYAPWEVFHVGLAHTAGLSIGVASIIAGVLIAAIVTLTGEKLGLGTVLSMFLTGAQIDLIMALNFIHAANGLPVGIPMLIGGLFVVSLGTYFYIKSAFGVGPRDNLMVVLSRRTKLPVGVCRSVVELLVTIIGWRLGGMVGIGTIISVITIGFCVQAVFTVFRFKPTSVQHETLGQTYRALVGIWCGKNDCSSD